jgi:HlyD family secretion protein
MKPFLLSVFGLSAFGLFACAPAPKSQTLTGYGEAIYVHAAALEAGRISALRVEEGAAIAAGAALFTIDAVRGELSADAARLSAAAAQARAGAALSDAIARAQAQAELAKQTQARLDTDTASLNAATAALAQARAEQRAARIDAGAAGATARLADRRVKDYAVTAPISGTVERIWRRPGEIVAAGEPVLAILAPENMRVRFFAPQADLARLAPGAEIALACDGCKAGLTAKITHTAREPQYTPPVIYTAESRGRLVYLIEAKPSEPGAIRPGQPVDISLPGPP